MQQMYAEEAIYPENNVSISQKKKCIIHQTLSQ